MSIVLPKGWCDDGADSHRHRYMRCLEVKIISGQPCQCTKRVRASTNDVPHSHQFELPNGRSQCGSQALLQFHQDKIKEGVAKMIACTNLAAKQAENKALKEVVLIAIKAGQSIPNKPPELIYPVINRQNIIPIINNVADAYQKERLCLFKNGFSCLSLDAGTLIHRHFLDFVISSSPSVKPLLYDAIEVGRLGAKEYGSYVLDQVVDLFKNSVRMGPKSATITPCRKWQYHIIHLVQSSELVNAMQYERSVSSRAAHIHLH